jgi:hypothetical protein
MSSLRGRLLASGAIAAVLAAAEPAFADPLNVSGWWASVDGGFLWNDDTKQPLLPLPGLGLVPAQSIRVNEDFTGQIAIGGNLGFDPAWDFRLAYTGIHSLTHRHGAMGSTPNGSTISHSVVNEKISQQFNIGDFDVGQHLGLGGADVRGFGGVRVFGFDQDAKAQLLNYTTLSGTLHSLIFSANAKSVSDSWGAGPRIGVTGSYPLTQLGVGTVSLNGLLAGAILAGEIDHKYAFSNNFSSIPGGSYESKSNSTQPVYNLSTEASLGYAFPLGTTETQISIGYRLEAWWDVANTQSLLPPSPPGTPAGTKNGHEIYQGPFVRLTVKF